MKIKDLDKEIDELNIKTVVTSENEEEEDDDEWILNKIREKIAQDSKWKFRNIVSFLSRTSWSSGTWCKIPRIVPICELSDWRQIWQA